MQITTDITLDIYNHAKKPTTVNAIALDDNSRLVRAKITNGGEAIDVGSGATVKLIVVRPDKTVAQIDGEVYSYEEDGNTIYGVQAELDGSAIELSGKCTAQFKMTSSSQIMRSDIFYIDVAQALDYGVEESSDVESLEIETPLPSSPTDMDEFLIQYCAGGRVTIPVRCEKRTLGESGTLPTMDGYGAVSLSCFYGEEEEFVKVPCGSEVAFSCNENGGLVFFDSAILIPTEESDNYIILDANNHEGSPDRFKNPAIGVTQILWDPTQPLPEAGLASFIDSTGDITIASWSEVPLSNGEDITPTGDTYSGSAKILYAQWASK